MEEYHGGIDLGEEMPEVLYEPDEEMFVEETVESIPADEFQGMRTRVPKGRMLQNVYYPPEADRKDYLFYRSRENFEREHEGFAPLDGSRFVHLERNPLSLNFYPPDTRRVMEQLQEDLGDERWYITNGYRSTKEGYTNAHTAGLAMDVLVETRDDARRLMDAAYLIGIRAIAIGGEFDAGEGFVHLDIGPKAEWNYGEGSYHGPGS